MEKEIIKNSHKITGICWGIIASTITVVAGQFSHERKGASSPVLIKESLCYASQEQPDRQISEVAGFGIPGIGWPNIPIIPPIGPTLTLPTYYYNGPNVVPYYEQPEFVKDYFRNLQTNFPTNNVGNCGYVAAAMLLSYYDTYWNPNFIPDQYNNSNLTELDSLNDKTFDSPGVNDIHEDLWVNYQPMTAPDENSPEWYKKQYRENEKAAYRDYLDRMLARQDESFVALLYQKAIEAGVYDTDQKPDPGTNDKGMETFINYYLSKNEALAGKVSAQLKTFTDMDGPDETMQRNNFMDLAISKIEAGQPIIFIGKLITGGYHASIAYDYNVEDGFIIHLGSKLEGHSMQKWWNYYLHFDGFISLEISTELHTIPNNRRFRVDSSEYSCHDLGAFVHKEVPVSYQDEDFHALLCSCGKVKYEKHSFVNITNDTKKCTICGKTMSKPDWSN